MTPERLAEIEARLATATPGPWDVWDGPAYCGGGRDLCIGAGEDWLANMDHRYGPDYQARVDHDSDGEHSQHGAFPDGGYPPDCPICAFSDKVTQEQRANADLIAHAPTDLADLLAEVRRLDPGTHGDAEFDRDTTPWVEDEPR